MDEIPGLNPRFHRGKSHRFWCWKPQGSHPVPPESALKSSVPRPSSHAPRPWTGDCGGFGVGKSFFWTMVFIAMLGLLQGNPKRMQKLLTFSSTEFLHWLFFEFCICLGRLYWQIKVQAHTSIHPSLRYNGIALPDIKKMKLEKREKQEKTNKLQNDWTEISNKNCRNCLKNKKSKQKNHPKLYYNNNLKTKT